MMPSEKKDSLLQIIHMILAMISVLFLTSCDSGGKDYFPLEAGLTWSYQMHYETMDGAATVPYIVTNFSIENNPSGEQIYWRSSIDGRNFLYQYDDFGLKMLEWNRADGLSVDINSSGEYLFPSQFKKGDQWQGETVSHTLIKTGPPQKTEFRITARIPVKSIIKSTDEVVKVPAGKFDHCMKVHMTGSTFHNAGNYVGNTYVKVKEDRWYCPGIGLVKTVRREETTSKALDKGMMSLELERFQS